MNLLIVSSSQRTGSQSVKVANYLAKHSSEFKEVNHIELCRYDLPFWDGDHKSKYAEASPWTMIAHKIRKADALILITPEWGGMASPLLKNFLLMCDNKDTAHKPALLVSVVSGISGAYPIAELRMNAMKNNKLVAIPDHLIIRNVTQVLNSADEVTQEESQLESDLKQRIDYSLYMLHQYSQALATIRFKHENEPYPEQQEYSFGM
ncbi:NADPH-dependent FMN reductase [Shewanella violacea]|uniref:Azoreductase, putative n=1 Tax=Shewanella violacea (strain JCM 10179 / CIP 106290 / LMG 19151 / DSS12) TaxID=637905 RepID=D4ZGJ2_SHEVD|nr:NAD(P)H-dependent oxidoreductase [Shewanella violacea]BAJ00791.1 azoreductase, putative [Shewanella violacea DSS12]